MSVGYNSDESGNKTMIPQDDTAPHSVVLNNEAPLQLVKYSRQLVKRNKHHPQDNRKRRNIHSTRKSTRPRNAHTTKARR